MRPAPRRGGKPTETDKAIHDIQLTRRHRRIVVIASLLLLVTASHWWTPRDDQYLHAVHVALRKMYLLPVVLAAVWFDLRGALIASAACTLLYLPHVRFQWSGAIAENINQVGEILSIWLAGVLTGVFVGREKTAFREVAASHEGALLAMVAALDAREHQTELHSLRVREYALRLAREMSLPVNELNVIAAGALLHDVGKIGVPDGILLKAGPLSPEEWKEMRQHPEKGARILESLPFLADAAEIVRSHHEKFDGTGYPRGLREKEIPLGARVFAVVDVLDALTSQRRYRRRSSFEDALAAIRAESTHHFDPEVVAAFERIPVSEWEGIHKHRGSLSAEKAFQTV